MLTYGASPMPARAARARCSTLFPELDIYQGYGMTESSAVLTALGPDDHRAGGRRLRSAGRPLPGVVLSIQDLTAKPLPPGETGEVCARAGNFMREYWKKPEATAEAFRGGWYHSGDAGYLDDDGYLFLVDRVKDMIVTGGENVYSVEVENAIASHPAVAQVAVIGMPSREVGRGRARDRGRARRRRRSPRPRSSSTPASGSPATRSRSRSSSAPSRSRCRAR